MALLGAYVSKWLQSTTLEQPMKEHGPPRRSRVSVVEKKQHLRPPGSLRNCLVGILLVCGNETGELLRSLKCGGGGGGVVCRRIFGTGLLAWTSRFCMLLGLSRAHPRSSLGG